MKSMLSKSRKSFFALPLFMLLALIAGCENTPTASDPNGEFASIEASVHQQVNSYRVSKGLTPLTLATVITAQARIHSGNMAAGRTALDHEGFEARVTEISKTIALTNSGENVAFNMGFDDPATKAVQDWLNSPGHKANIEGNFNLTGIGVQKNAKGEYYFTQIFGKQ